jgi:alpha-glucuronidase
VEKESGAPKTLILRTWLSGWRERLLLDMFPLRGVPDDVAREIVLSTKNTTGDFAMMDPFNPLFERTPEFEQIIEFDTGAAEYRGFNWYPCAMGRRWQQQVREARRLGVQGVAFSWCPFEVQADSKKDGWNSGYEVKNYGSWANLNAVVLAALVRDPDCDVDAVQRQWIRDHYGDAAVEPLARVLDMSYDVMGKIMYTRTIGHNDHSAFANTRMRPTILERMHYILCEWRGAQRPDAMGDLEITRENVEAIVREKEEGVSDAREMLEIVEQAKDAFRPDDHRALRDDLRSMVNHALANQCYIEAYFRHRLSETLDGRDREAEVALVDKAIAAGRPLQKAEPDFLGREGPKSFTLLFDELEGAAR